MKFIRYACSLLCVLCTFIYAPLSLNAAPIEGNADTLQQNTSVSNGCYSVDASMALLGNDKLVEKVDAAFVYETKSDTVMYAMNADAKMYPSSLVKIVTALIAAERGNPDDLVTVKEDVLSTVPWDAVSAKLQPGEVLKLDDLVYCMMVGSANDAAAVIADHISGSQEDFVLEMNQYVQSLGCTQTNFVNAHGLHDEQQYTTARDMMRILSVAVKNPSFVNYFNTTHYVVEATNKSDIRELTTGNFLMHTDEMEIYYDPRVTGGRTGTTEEGKQCLATSAENNGMELLCVVMGAESIRDDNNKVRVFGGFKGTTALLDASFNGYKTVQILYPGQTILQESVLNGESEVILGVDTAVYAVLPEGVSAAQLNYRYTDNLELKAPIQKGERLSNVQIWNGNLCVAHTDLYAMNSVSAAVAEVVPNNETVDGHPWLTVLIIVGGICVCVVAVLLSIRYYSVIKYKIHHKRYRKARRRSR